MALASDPNNILLGKGELFFNRFSAAGVNSNAFFHLGNCSKFEVKITDKLLSLYTSQNHSAGLLKRVTSQRDCECDITSNEFAIESLALALMGDQSTFAQSATTATETLASGFTAGRFYKTVNRNISGIKITQGTVTWAPTTDYTVHDATAGVYQIAAAPSTAVVSTSAATLVYTAASLSLSMILAATDTKVEGALKFIPDPTTGPAIDVDVWHVAVNPSGAIGLIADAFGEYTLNMAVLSDTAGTYGGSPTCPYFQAIQRGTA